MNINIFLTKYTKCFLSLRFSQNNYFWKKLKRQFLNTGTRHTTPFQMYGNKEADCHNISQISGGNNSFHYRFYITILWFLIVMLQIKTRQTL